MSNIKFSKYKKKILAINIFIVIMLILIFTIFYKSEVLPIEIISWDEFNYTDKHIYITQVEYFLVKNPPTKIKDIKKVVDEYNNQIPIKTSSQEIQRVERVFLRESKYTTYNKIKDKNLEDNTPIDGIAIIVFDANDYKTIYAMYNLKKKNGDLIDRLIENFQK